MTTIRTATLNDVEGIYSLIEATRQRVECFSQRTREYIGENIAGFVVAEEDGRIIGNGQILVLPIDDTSEIRSMCVDFASQSRGVGTKILEALIGKATTNIILVECVPHNRVFYEKCGFKPIGALRDIYEQKAPKDLYEAIKSFPSKCARFPDQCPGIIL